MTMYERQQYRDTGEPGFDSRETEVAGSPKIKGVRLQIRLLALPAAGPARFDVHNPSSQDPG